MSRLEQITFDQLVEHGRRVSSQRGPNDMPWSFSYKGMAVTHENDKCYVVSGVGHMEPGDVLYTSMSTHLQKAAKPG